ncbi:MAG: class I SAM-dependent methyltransferase [Lachnospiraceae bacterium]|nr:class I SAM-dependent methyltransferase [Lachnospiraceae bacterium]MCM1239647.1 class I SAM-dependent methyltransferase [Lachnospiraceae bacterium]
MKKIIIGTGKWGKMAVSYYGESQIAYFVDKLPIAGELPEKIPLLDMSELSNLPMDDHEVVICAGNYWEMAELLESMGVMYTVFPPICETWPAISQKIAHDKWVSYLVELFDRPEMEILEIGSRKVTSGDVRSNFKKAKYTGFDIYAGQNVDVVGDAHHLSSYFEDGKKFDLIFSSAVFEHLAMSWKVAEEISKMLKLGGCFFVETHFSYSYHEKPWMFFQFSDMALRVLFNRELGFEVIEAGVSDPMRARFSCKASSYLKGQNIGNLWCHSEIFGKKVSDSERFDWNQVDVDKLVGETHYPEPEGGISAQEQTEQIIDSMKRLTAIAEENDLNSNGQLYRAVTEMLEISTGYLDKLLEGRLIRELGIDGEDWKMYRELIAYSRDNVINLHESVIPFTKYLLEVFAKTAD